MLSPIEAGQSRQKDTAQTHTVRVTSRVRERERERQSTECSVGPVSPARSEGRRLDLLRKELRPLHWEASAKSLSDRKHHSRELQTQQLSHTEDLVSMKLWVQNFASPQDRLQSAVINTWQRILKTENSGHQQIRALSLCHMAMCLCSLPILTKKP